jgi:hypothetical protein
LEFQMKKKALVIGGIAAATLLIGGFAFAQATNHGSGVGAAAHGQMAKRGHANQGTHDQTDMNEHMDHGMRRPMGSDLMGRGMQGMNHGTATAGEHSDIHDLLFNDGRINRTVTNLPDGIRTVTESDDLKTAETIKRHVAEMGQRVEQSRDPGLPIESPALKQIFRDKDKITTSYEVTDNGVIVVQTSTDAATVKALQAHAAEVSDLTTRGMIAVHEAMMKNGANMMLRSGPINEQQH